MIDELWNHYQFYHQKIMCSITSYFQIFSQILFPNSFYRYMFNTERPYRLPAFQNITFAVYLDDTSMNISTMIPIYCAHWFIFHRYALRIGCEETLRYSRLRYLLDTYIVCNGWNEIEKQYLSNSIHRTLEFTLFYVNTSMNILKYFHNDSHWKLRPK